jgi:hypothetical protein
MTVVCIHCLLATKAEEIRRERIAKIMTGVAFALFANDMTGVIFARRLPPFSGKRRIIVWNTLELANF